MSTIYGPLPDEHELVELAKTDDAAFSRLYAHYFPQVYGFVVRRVGQRETAEDIVSQVFVKVVEHIPRLNCSPSRPFNAWLFRVASTTLIDYRRAMARRRTESLPAVDTVPDSAASAEHVTDIWLERQRLEKALDGLPERYQRVLHLKYFAQLSNEEIAQAMGCTSTNAGVLIHRALKQAHKIYGKYAK